MEKDAKDILKELMPLRVGEDDTIRMLGSDAQESMNRASKMLSSIASNDASDKTIDLLECISKNIEKTDKTASRFFKTHGKEIMRNEEAIKLIEDFAVQLQVQRVRLSKNLIVMRRIEQDLQQCLDDLENSIKIGEKLLSSKNDTGKGNNLGLDPSEDWFRRLEERIDELKTSKIVALQTLKQIQILQINSRELVRRVGETLTSTIPLWRNQATMGI